MNEQEQAGDEKQETVVDVTVLRLRGVVELFRGREIIGEEKGTILGGFVR